MLGEDNHHAKHSNKLIEEICKLLADPNNTPTVIAKKFNIDPWININIKSGNSWGHISSNYDICEKDLRLGENCSLATYKDDQVRKVCEMLTEGGHTANEIEKATGVGLQAIHDIRRRSTWCHISKDYNFSSDPLPRYVEPRVIEATKYFKEGLSIEEIIPKVASFFDPPDRKKIWNFLYHLKRNHNL